MRHAAERAHPAANTARHVFAVQEIKTVTEAKSDMANMSKHHRELTNGVGKCSVPMWMGGCPAGFCDKPAFGHRPEPKRGETFRDVYTGETVRMDGKYNGYVPGLACPAHGGPDCPGMEIEPGVFSGCNQSGGDCPTCGR